MLFAVLTVFHMHLFLFGLNLDSGFSDHRPQYSIVDKEGTSTD